MPYRNKTYIAFDGDTDMSYYRKLQMWKANENINFEFYDAHDLNTARDTSLTDSIKNQLRVRFDNSKLFMILVGESTKWNRKFIPWEIEQALSRSLPIVVVYINGSRQKDGDMCPSLLSNALAIHIPFKASIMQYSFDNWPSSHASYKADEKLGAYVYKDEVYKSLRI
jgi:hypothetical protein